MTSNSISRPPGVVFIRTAAMFAAFAAVVFGLTMVAAGPLENVGLAGNAYAIISTTSGLVLLAAALRGRSRTRTAWSLIGAGVLCWGIGEIVWVVQAAATGEVPYPGAADFFYVAGYPLIFIGVIFLPYLRPGRYERIRLAIDATAGAVSLAVVMWVAYLNQVVSLGSEPVETFLNLLYPFGDVLLAAALMVLAMRRSVQRLDLRVLALAAGVALTTVADVVFSLQTVWETYVEWGWLDGLYLLAYGSFAVTAYILDRKSVV